MVLHFFLWTSKNVALNFFAQNINELIIDVLFIGCFFLGVSWIFNIVKKQLLSVERGLIEAMATDSLSAYEQTLPTEEIGNLGRFICLQVVQVDNTFKTQVTNATKLVETTGQLTTCMEIINDSMEEEFAQVELLATAMTQMTSSVQEVSHNAQGASSATTEATDVAQQGSQFVDATIKTINSLSQNIGASAQAVNDVELKVEGIGSVVDTIRSISDQTNLLALNAAIEAARAGEAGRGFAVVADEVRNLAKRTQDATIEIQGMIEQLQNSAQQAVGLMGKSVHEADTSVEQVTQAGTKLAGIVAKVHEISDMNYHIASAAQEQNTVVADINENLDQVKEVVEGSVVILKEVTEMTQEMMVFAEQIKVAMQR